MLTELSDEQRRVIASLTDEERKAIASLKRLAKKWPESLWLFSASGTLNVMKKHEDGYASCYGDNVPPSNSRTEGVCEDYIVDTINGIENDGGDW